jgi:large subunit ribosomal protein L33
MNPTSRVSSGRPGGSRGEGDPQRSGRPRTEKTRLEVVLCCSECKTRNYKTTKRPEQVLAMRKFCKTCNAHTLHQESK